MEPPRSLVGFQLKQQLVLPDQSAFAFQDVALEAFGTVTSVGIQPT